MSRTIEVTLKFTQEDLDRLLEEVGDLPAVEELTARQFSQLKKELQASAESFVEEIILGSYEAAGDDWLSEFREQFA